MIYLVSSVGGEGATFEQQLSVLTGSGVTGSGQLYLALLSLAPQCLGARGAQAMKQVGG